MTIQILDLTNSFRQLDDRVAGPGEIVVATLSSDAIDGLAEALRASARMPWCPVVVASLSPPSERTLRTLQLKAGKVTAIKLTPGSEGPTGSEVVDAVSKRPEVRPGEFLGYVGLRAGSEVRATVEAALAGERSARLRRAAHRVGPLTPADWGALWTYIRAISMAHRYGLTQEKTAFRLGTAARTLWLWSTNFAKLNWKDAVSLRAWEPVLEVTLRVHGLALDTSIPRRRISGDYLAVMGE